MHEVCTLYFLKNCYSNLEIPSRLLYIGKAVSTQRCCLNYRHHKFIISNTLVKELDANHLAFESFKATPSFANIQDNSSE
jgi:hypothetical protein